MKVLVADDHALIREGMVHALKIRGVAEDIVEAHDSESVLSALVNESGIDVLLLDLYMPGANGFELLHKVCNEFPSLPVIVVSAAEEPFYMRKSIDNGASGFIPKSAPMEIMVSAIQLVRNGGIYIPPDMVTSKENTVDEPSMRNMAESNAEQPNSDNAIGKLTNRQREVLGLLAKGKSNKEIANDLGVSEHTVKIHVTAILRVFNASNRTEVVVLAQNIGMLTVL